MDKHARIDLGRWTLHSVQNTQIPLTSDSTLFPKIWADFIILHLHQPHKDGHELLKGDQTFVMAMEDGMTVIGKVEKGFELIIKAHNL